MHTNTSTHFYTVQCIYNLHMNIVNTKKMLYYAHYIKVWQMYLFFIV